MQPTTWQLIAQASWIVKFILAILGGLSVVSWGLILYKYVVFLTASRESAVFLQAFESDGDAKPLREIAQSLHTSPIARVYAACHVRGSGTALDRVVAQVVAMEIDRLQAYLTFLATTASAAPFIGLLGTVWGIMDAFRGIGAAGSASLAVVSPAIAEALITTAAGLLAAIPAVIAYNAFLHWSRKMARDVEAFAEHLPERLGERPRHADHLAARARV